MRRALDFERLTPEPGPDADAVTHEFVAHCTADARGVLEVGGIATVWDLLVDGEVVRSGRSMFERHVVDVAAGDHEVRIVVHPLTELLESLPTKPRQRWRTMLVEEASCAGCGPSCSAARRGSRRDHRWSGRTARSPWSPVRGPAQA